MYIFLRSVSINNAFLILFEKTKKKNSCEMIIMEEELIKFIKRNPFLYDKRDANYKNSSLRKEKYHTLSRKLNIPVKVLQDRWRTLRDKFNKEIKRKDLHKAQKKWKWMDRLSFLADSNEIKYLKNDEEVSDPFINLDVHDDSDEFIIGVSQHTSPVPSVETNKTFKDIINMTNNVLPENCLYNSSIDIFFQGFALQTHEANLTNIEFSSLQIRLLQTFNDFLKKRTEI